MKRITLLALSVALLPLVTEGSPEIPGAVQSQPVALVGGTIHPAGGEPIVEGTLVFAGGKIVALGEDVKIPEDAQRIDISGKHVYPGLIDACTEIGLVEISAVRATRDQSETGLINPNVRAEVAFNPDSELIPVGRSNGVLTVLSAPGGGLIQGLSAVMRMDGWSYEDMTLRAPAGLHVAWPRMTPIQRWWLKDSAKKQMEQRDERLKQLRDTFAAARAYVKAHENSEPDSQNVDVRWEAMRPVLEGRVPMIVEAEELQQIQSAVAFAQRENIQLIILGGYDAPLAADLLKQQDVPVIVRGVQRLPMRRHEAYDTPFTVPARLKEAGIRFCISGSGWSSNVRNLPYHAATAAAYGLTQEEALRAITLSAAEILGVADQIGSLATGKEATLIITDGDPLLTETQIEQAFIQGRQVDLNDRHKRLNAKYQEKYRRLELAKQRAGEQRVSGKKRPASEAGSE